MKAYHLEEAVAHAGLVEELELSRVSYSALERTLPRLPALRRLTLRKSKLERLPAALFSCTALSWLALEQVRLKQLPEAIGQLQQLHTLSLVKNQLETLPASLADCINLRILRLSNNQLGHWPELTARLPWLAELDLAHNGITALPEVLPSCKALRLLDLRGNGLTALPEAAPFPALETLLLGGNQLTEIPISWLQLPRLRRLDLSGNPIHRLPPLPAGLRWINLRHCAPEGIPEAFLGMENLQGAPGIPAALEKKLRDFLAFALRSALPDTWRSPFFQAFCGETSAIAGFSPRELLPFLGAARGNFRELLHRQIKSEKYPPRGSTVAVVGKAEGLYGDWRKMLSEASDIRWVSPEAAEWLALGRAPFHIPASLRADVRVADLGAWWYSLQSETRASPPNPEPLRRLLLSADAGNLALAARLMQASTIPDELCTEVLYAWLTAPDPDVRRLFRQQLERSLAPEQKKVLRLPWNAQLRQHSNFKPWAIKVLENTVFSGPRLLELWEQWEKSDKIS